jgi:hypothetical protein
MHLNSAELSELSRLLSDVEMPAKKIAADRNLLELLANQFTVRMNNAKQYKTQELSTALKDLID